jgi:hypothetical protein
VAHVSSRAFRGSIPIMRLSTLKSRRFRFLYGWLIVAVFFYLVDCWVATSSSNSSLPWFERGIYAGGPFGLLLTVGWFMFPLCRIIFKRIKTRPRD